MKLLAKSESKGLLYLEEHTLHVIQAIEPMATHFGLDPKVARMGAILHDLGKAHPYFQALLIAKPRANRKQWLSELAGANLIEAELTTMDGRNDAPPHRHEISSLGFLPLFERAYWNELIEMVVGHHKSVSNDKSKKGILDLEGLYEDDGESLIASHLNEWDMWSVAAIAVVSTLGVPKKKISKKQAEEALLHSLHYVQQIEDGWSPWRGLLMAADHFASGYQWETKVKTKELFHAPDLSIYNLRTQSTIAPLYPLSQSSTDDERPHTIVTAPTGAGKTDFLVRRCKGRVFYILPFQASINAMYKRFKSDLPAGTDIRRLHAASMVALDGSRASIAEAQEEVDLQHHPGASVKVMTPHQLAGLVFCTPGHESIALDVTNQDIILDEIHTFNEASQVMVIQIVKALVKHGCRIHIGTATLPKVLEEHLLQVLGGHKEVYSVNLPPQVLDDFDRHIIHKTWKNEVIGEDQLLEIVHQAVSNNEKLLIVMNRVKRAQSLYARFLEIYNDSEVEILLIHSRYRRTDRAELEQQIIAAQKERAIRKPVIAVATQVVEVSLDISYDRMITQAAPLDAMIQRFGRVNRKRRPREERELRSIHIMKPDDNAKDALPYGIEVIKKSFALLPDGDVLHERNTQYFMDAVYETLGDLNPNSAYMIDENGNYLISKLRHHPRSVIVDVLNIEGSTCILQSEVETYRQATFREKPLYEIPVPKNFGIWNKLKIEECGSYPYVLPDDMYRYAYGDKRGVISVQDTNNFI